MSVTENIRGLFYHNIQTIHAEHCKFYKFYLNICDDNYIKFYISDCNSARQCRIIHEFIRIIELVKGNNLNYLIDELEYDENDMLVNKRADKIKKLHAEFMSITNRMKRANCGFPTDFVFHHKIINKTRQTNGEMQFDIQLLLNKE